MINNMVNSLELLLFLTPCLSCHVYIESYAMLHIAKVARFLSGFSGYITRTYTPVAYIHV
jgi:hypothetical protein